ncbi:hypothetical protein [Pedobacter nototheniae]|uniref:hypothetical protein n=1 Tax=Pedobacter nototheniae TaxID=2488994 RepID=UPI00292D0DCD|nr:hypothetical protein [Pedobacter nototheniae]
MTIYHILKNITKNILNEVSGCKINFSLFKIKQAILFPQANKKVISFSLFGHDKKYFANIDSCMTSYHTFFPDWVIRIYVSDDLKEEVLKKIKSYRCELIIMKSRGIDFRYTFWRYLVLDDKSVSHALVRDIDSIASEREKLMVDEWMNSNKTLHIIRDHPDHTDLIMGGLFDRRFDPSFKMEKAMLKFRKLNKLGIDQRFLKLIYNHYSPDILVHDILKRYAKEEPVIIPHQSTESFIGEINVNHQHKRRDLEKLKQFYIKPEINE